MIPKTDGSFDYEYFIKDHLGNTRVTIQEKEGLPLVMQENHYDPFGYTLAGQTYTDGSQTLKNDYLYNGKELQDELGLDWYDYGARFYDAVLGRWWAIDNKVEKYFSISPYVYAIDNPINVIDPDGNDIIILAGYFSAVGHSAVLIGNDKTGWRLYSKNGTTWSTGAYGPSNKHPEKGITFNNLKEFANSESNFDEEGNQKYYEGFLIESGSNVDALMEDAAEESLESYYDVLKASCIDVSSDALNAGGFDDGKGIYTSPVPNARYESIKENNQGKVITNGLKPDKKTEEKNKQKANIKKAIKEKEKQREKQKRAEEFTKSHLEKISDEIYGNGGSK